MRNILALIGGGIVLLAGLGWYLDWFSIKRQPSGEGVQSLQVDIHSKKIIRDSQNALERGSELLRELQENEGKNGTKGAPIPASLPAPHSNSSLRLLPSDLVLPTSTITHETPKSPRDRALILP